MDIQSIYNMVAVTPDGVVAIQTSPSGTSKTMSFTVVNDGPGAITNIEIAKQTTNILSCPWVPMYGSDDFSPDNTGLMSNNILEATIGLPRIEAGASAVVSFVHHEPYLIQLELYSNGPTTARIYCRR